MYGILGMTTDTTGAVATGSRTFRSPGQHSRRPLRNADSPHSNRSCVDSTVHRSHRAVPADYDGLLTEHLIHHPAHDTLARRRTPGGLVPHFRRLRLLPDRRQLPRQFPLTGIASGAPPSTRPTDRAHPTAPLPTTPSGWVRARQGGRFR